MSTLPSIRTRLGAVVGVVALGGAVAFTTGTARAAVPGDTSALREAVTSEAIMAHLAQFEAFAEANDGNRAAGTAGHEASLDYIEGLLDAAGYDTWRQPFSYDRTVYENAVLQMTAPATVDYEFGTDFYPMTYSGSGTVEAGVTPVDVNLAGDRASTSGCEAEDFAGFPDGDIALIQRGGCNFSVKADNAATAGAAAVVIFNQGNEDPADDRFGLFGGTLDPPVRGIPVVSATFDAGSEWAGTEGLRLRLVLDVDTVRIDTENLLADTPTGRTDRMVVAGGHLDSVPEGPGINDNGSGTATLLETALQLAGTPVRNQVRFAFWSGEEDGLIGSDYYVSQLTKRQVKATALNLNFDMIGSVNAVNFVYDGDGDAYGTAGPNGSDVIEDVFNDFFASVGEPTEPTAFDGRSDYFGFIEAGIPAGGLFTGAEDIKTEEQAAIFGGTAGRPYDPCYHAECDDLSNVDEPTLDLMADAVAHATLTFAQTTAVVNGTNQGTGGGQLDMAFKGDRARR